MRKTASPWKSTRRRLGCCVAALSLAGAQEARCDESDSLPLPQWSPPPGRVVDPDAANPLNLGGGLWPKGAEGQEASEAATTPATPVPTTSTPPAELEDNGGFTNFFKLFIPHSSSPVPAHKESALPPHPIQPEVLQPAMDAEADTYYLDPQLMISETQAEDVKRLLANHANGAKVAIYLLVLAPGQALPEHCDLGRIASGALLQRLSCLAVYPLDEPWRARLFTSKEIVAAASGASLSRMSQDCIRDAMDASDEVEQIQRFITQLSIHLFWLERSYPLPSRRQVSLPTTPLRPSATRDFLPEVETQVPDPNYYRELLQRWAPQARLGLAALAALLVAAGIWRGLAARRRRTLAQSVWILPEVEIHQRRLGAPHCGGYGRKIHYG